jgi:hypothetical protein
LFDGFTLDFLLGLFVGNLGEAEAQCPNHQDDTREHSNEEGAKLVPRGGDFFG